MDKKADYALREHLKIAKQQLKELLDEYSWLDDAERVLLKYNSTKELEQAIDVFVQKMKDILRVHLGDEALSDVAYDAYDDVVKRLRKYIEDGRIALDYSRRAEIVKQALRTITHREDSVFESLGQNLKAKIAHYKLLVRQKLNTVEQMITSTGQRIIERTFNISVKDANELRRYWKLLARKYGSTFTVIYADGKRFPVASYLDMKARTNSELVHSAVTEAIAVGSEIYFGKISRHNTTDSCIFWEGKIIFFNDVLKSAFMRRFPKYASLVSNWATLDDVRRDRTHMFSFNCRHTIMPYPLHLFGEDDMLRELKSNKMPSIPRKIKAEYRYAG